MFSSLILTLMELGILHIGHVLDGVSREESNSALTKNPYLLKQTLSQKMRKGLVLSGGHGSGGSWRVLQS